MKKFVTWCLITAMAAMSIGCVSTDKNYAAALAAQQAMIVANANAQAERFRQLGQIATSSTDPTSKSVAAMMIGMVQLPQQEVIRPPESEAYKWASILVPTVATLGMGYFTYKAGAVNSNNQRDVAISTNQSFASMGNSIATAGTAGYQFIQAPGAVTTNTLSGTGVLGSGTYTAPVTTTTTHNCYGGSAAAGGSGAAGGAGSATSPGGAGGAGATGGSSPGGNC